VSPGPVRTMGVLATLRRHAIVALVVVLSWPVLELAVLIQLSHVIGSGPTVLAMLATSLFGTWWLWVELRSVGRALRRRAARQGSADGQGSAAEVSGRDPLDQILVLLGCAALAFPGFVSDLFGVLLLVPITRGLVRRTITRGTAARWTGAVPRVIKGQVVGEQPPGEKPTE